MIDDSSDSEQTLAAVANAMFMPHRARATVAAPTGVLGGSLSSSSSTAASTTTAVSTATTMRASALTIDRLRSEALALDVLAADDDAAGGGDADADADAELPPSFASVDHYKQTFFPLLARELRAQLVHRCRRRGGTRGA